MTNEISFPGLGINLTLNNVAFTIFGLDIAWYGVIITAGIILAVVFASTQAKSFGIDADRMLDVVIIGVICGVAGARIYYIIFDPYKSLADFFDFRGGGLAIYGGIIGAALAVVVAAPLRKVPVLPLMDLTGMGFLIGQAMGRWGNFFNQEAFGSNTNAPWGMISPQTTRYLAAHEAQLAAQGIVVDPYAPVHPTFLYESLWCALGFLLLFLYRKHRKFNGEIALFYAIWYGLGRFWIEGLRTDSLMLGDSGVRVSQLLAALCVLAGLAVWVMARVKTRGQPLCVPVIPDRTARVKLDGEVVEIRWPGGEGEPKEREKRAMAEEVLAARKAQAEEDEDRESGGPTDEATGEAENAEVAPDSETVKAKPVGKAAKDSDIADEKAQGKEDTPEETAKAGEE